MKDTGEAIANQFDKKQLKPILSLYSKGKFSEAIIALESLITSYPEVVTLFTLRGACYKKSGLFKQAIKDYQYILTLNPDDRILFDAHYQLGNLFIKSEEYEKAIDHCIQALAIKADDKKVHELIIFAISNLNKRSKASADFWYGVYLENMGKLNEAIYRYSKAFARNPKNDLAISNLRNILVDWHGKKSINNINLQLKQLRENSIQVHNTLINHQEDEGWKESRVRELKRLNTNIISNISRCSPKQLSYPRLIHLETLSQCNAACNFCPYPTLERKGNKMPDSVIEKVINDLVDIPKSHTFSFLPYKVSEPFLDVRIFDILHNVNDLLPNAGIYMYSNGSVLTEKNIQRLSQVKIKQLFISLNEYQEKPYEELMHIPFQRTYNCLKLLHKKKASGEFIHKVSIGRVMNNTPDDLHFYAWATNQFPLFTITLTPRNDWIGQVDEDVTSSGIPNTGCKRWHGLSITSTGEVALCCMDGESKYPLGNVTNMHVLDIYNQERYRNLRENIWSRHDAPEPCNKCTYI